MPRVTVVVPAYNAAALLPATLQSVVGGSYADYEVVVIDDGSTDDTAEVAAAFGPTVKVVSQANRGMSASRNRGMARSDSEFVALLDADDVWHPHKLQLQVHSLDAMPEMGLCYTEFFRWDGRAPPQFVPAPTAALDPAMSGWIYHQMIMTNHSLPSSVLLRRQTVEQMGPFLCNDQQTDDWEYLVRASTRFRFAKIAAPLVAYRQAMTSLSNRARKRNVTEEMRDELIARYGMTSPQGMAVDAEELARVRYKSWRDFAAVHVSRADLKTGVKTFIDMLKSGPRRSATATVFAKTLARRVVGFRQS